ncbi:MAG: hypothetical protein HGN29_18430 [Asgard group archaeon]|nr:hypothetical protein [Asgard group archaeon]
MIDEIMQFHDKGDEIVVELCEKFGAEVLEVDFQYYELTTIKISPGSSQEIFDYLSMNVQQETDVIRKKCLIFIIAKLIEETQLVPSVAIDVLMDESESPYILFRLAFVLYHEPAIQNRCIEVFQQVILNKENHMDMRYESITILNRLAEIDKNPILITIFLEVIALEEYYFEDPYFAGHNMGDIIITDDSFDPDYSEHWIIDIKELAIDGLSYFPDHFELVATPLLKFMTEEYQIDEYISAVARTLTGYIFDVPHATRFLLDKVDFLYENNEGAKVIVDAIMEFHGVKKSDTQLPL